MPLVQDVRQGGQFVVEIEAREGGFLSSPSSSSSELVFDVEEHIYVASVSPGTKPRYHSQPILASR